MITDNDCKPCPACINEFIETHSVQELGSDIGDLAEFGPMACPDHINCDMASETAKALNHLPEYEAMIGQPVVNTFKRNLRLVN